MNKQRASGMFQNVTHSQLSDSEKKVFDDLTLLEKDDNYSKWQGGKGIYIFRHFENVKGKRPVAQVILNRKHLSGVFRTAKPLEFSGDLIEDGERKFIYFQVSGKKMRIVLR